MDSDDGFVEIKKDGMNKESSPISRVRFFGSELLMTLVAAYSDVCKIATSQTLLLRRIGIRVYHALVLFVLSLNFFSLYYLFISRIISWGKNKRNC